MTERKIITGWVGAALQLEQVDDEIAKRRDMLIWHLGKLLWNATQPDIPEDERAAMLADSVKFGHVAHAQVRADKAIQGTYHAAWLDQAVASGAAACEPYQRRVIDANVTCYLDVERAAKCRAEFLDAMAPSEATGETPHGAEK